MTPLHWTLTTVAAAILLALAGLLVYDVTAMQRGWPTLTELAGQLRRLGVFTLGALVGLVCGFIAGHLFWPPAR